MAFQDYFNTWAKANWSPDYDYDYLMTQGGMGAIPASVIAEAKADYLNQGGAAAYNELKGELPSAVIERTPESLAAFRDVFGEHVQYGGQTEDQWDAFQDYYMGTADTPGAGTWTSVDGELRFAPTSPRGQYIDRGNWLTNFTSSLPALAAGVLNPIGTTYENIRTAHGIGDVANALFDPITGPGIDAVSGSLGAAIKDEPGLQSAVNVVGDVATGVLGVVYGPGGAAATQGIKGKILGTPNDQNLMNAGIAALATYAAQGLGDVALDPDALAIIADMEANAGYNAAVAAGEIPGAAAPGILAGTTPAGFDMTNVAGSPPPMGTWDTIKDFAKPVTDLLPDNTSQYLETGMNIANALGPGGVGGEDLPPLPGLLTADAPPDALPPLPDLESVGMPEGLTFPDVAPYLPKNWDFMSDAEKEAWMITRGGEIAKRRRGTWAGNLEGIRGGGTTDLKYAELVGLTGGKSILGA